MCSDTQSGLTVGYLTEQSKVDAAHLLESVNVAVGYYGENISIVKTWLLIRKKRKQGKATQQTGQKK